MALLPKCLALLALAALLLPAPQVLASKSGHNYDMSVRSSTDNVVVSGIIKPRAPADSATAATRAGATSGPAAAVGDLGNKTRCACGGCSSRHDACGLAVTSSGAKQQHVGSSATQRVVIFVQVREALHHLHRRECAHGGLHGSRGPQQLRWLPDRALQAHGHCHGLGQGRVAARIPKCNIVQALALHISRCS